MLSHIYKMLTELPLKDGILWFDLPIKISAPGLFPSTNIWGAAPQSNGDVILIDCEQIGFVLEANERSAQVMEDIFQRLRHLTQKANTKTPEEHI